VARDNGEEDLKLLLKTLAGKEARNTDIDRWMGGKTKID